MQRREVVFPFQKHIVILSFLFTYVLKILAVKCLKEFSLFSIFRSSPVQQITLFFLMNGFFFCYSTHTKYVIPIYTTYILRIFDLHE